MKIRVRLSLFILAYVMLTTAACAKNDNDNLAGASSSQSIQYQSQKDTTQTSQNENVRLGTDLTESDEDKVEEKETMIMEINDKAVDVTWEENASVEELKGLAQTGLTISMSMYGGFEQVGPIGKSIVSDDKQTVTKPGDIVLYSSDKIVVFYGSNSWSYTRLGKINMSQNELKQLLGNGDVTITLSIE